MKHTYLKYGFLPLIAMLFMISCSEWDDHSALTEGNLKKNALEVIKGDQELTIFYDMLVKTGYDSVLTDCPACTVFAPVNSSWDGVDKNDTEVVKGIIGSMITLLKFRASDTKYSGRIFTVNGKSMTFDASEGKFEDATILTPDMLSSNAYIHKVDKVVYRKDNIWECLSKKTNYKQVEWIMSQNILVMDPDKSRQIGINELGKIIYDTVWMESNPFIKEIPLNSEDSTYTYVIVSDGAYEKMISDYSPYFNTGDASATDLLVRKNISRDYVFKGNIDLIDRYNVDNVRVPLSEASIVEGPIDCSNGRVYVVSSAKIRLSDKIKTIRVEGEDYNACMNASFLYKRYKRWASGSYDIMINGSTYWDGMTFATSSGNIVNATNYWVEYLANVNSVNYKIRYVAYDDYGEDFMGFQLTQKLFISLPGEPGLKKREGTNTESIANNYLGDSVCFVGKTYCGYEAPQTTWLKKSWLTDMVSQFVDDNTAYTKKDINILEVPKYGQLKMWLCNTAYRNLSQSGPMFLDYIELVPQIPE
jgi:hypothetical protein